MNENRNIENDGSEIIKSIRNMTGTSSHTRNDGVRYTYEVSDKDRKMTVKQILKKRLGFSSRLISKLKKNGTVMRNGVEVRLFADTIPGDLIDVVLPAEKSDFPPQDIPIHVIYEDEDMLLINKQPWVVVHPTRGHPQGTVANGLTRRMLDTGEVYKIRFVNRLDRDTSGLLIIAKNSHCQDFLSKDMRSNLVEKRYLAVVHGIVSKDTGVTDFPIGRKDPDDIRRCVIDGGYPSVTHYRVLERFFGDGTSDGGGFTLLELKLDTGRTHQIRVHMSHIGHPIAGDTLYGKREDELIDRQALHAAYLKFRHPVSFETVEVEAELPEDIADLISRLRKNQEKQ